MKRFVITLLAVSLLSFLPCAAEAACGAGILRPFGGRGIPVVRRLRGRGVGQANYSGPYGNAGGCAGGSCGIR